MLKLPRVRYLILKNIKLKKLIFFLGEFNHHPQEHSAKFGYRTAMEVKIIIKSFLLFWLLTENLVA